MQEQKSSEEIISNGINKYHRKGYTPKKKRGNNHFPQSVVCRNSNAYRSRSGKIPMMSLTKIPWYQFS